MSSEPRQPYDLWSFPMPQAGATPPPPPPPPLRPPLRPPTDGPSSSPSSRRSAFARWRLALAMVVGLALGAAGMSAVELARGDGSVSLPTTGVTQPVQNPVTQNPVTQSPATTAPAAQSPSGTSGSTATSRDLTVGLVNIETVLGYEGAEAAGTGIVLSADGRVLTNNHVIEGSTEITVTVVATGKQYAAEVVGTAPSDDVALLQLKNASGLAVAPLGDSSKVKVGDAVIGIGNAGGTGRPTSSAGQVTALGQTITATDQSGGNAETLHNLIEISAQLQPGQSGGPLYGADGTVIGIDSAGSAGSGFGRSRFGGAYAGGGSGYAIPINDALALVKAIQSGQESDRITIGTPAMLGISAGDAAGGGAVVSGVTADTPAAKIGLQAGDVITSVDGKKITTVTDLTTVLRTKDPGDKVSVTWSRNGTTKTATATLIAGPAN